MNIKNKIIKWLGGYAQEDMIHAMNRSQATINYFRTEKQFIPIKATFAAKTNDCPDYVKHNLGYQIAEYILNFNLLYYDMKYDPSTDCYIYKAVLYVREP